MKKHFETLICVMVTSLFGIMAPSRVGADILYVSNSRNRGNGLTIEKFTSNGSGSVFANFSGGDGLAFDGAGNLYVAEHNNINKYDKSGAGTLFYSYDGFWGLNALAFDKAGNLYASVPYSFEILKVTTNGVGSVFASTGSGYPFGLAFDTAGNLYVACMGNNTIEKFAPNGEESDFASGGLLTVPQGLAFDHNGNLYVVNQGGGLAKFSPAGIGSVFASANLQIFSEGGIAFDTSNNLYVADYVYNTVLKFTPDGVRSVFASGGLLSGPRYLAFADDSGAPIKLPPPLFTTTTLTNVTVGPFFPGQSLTASYLVNPVPPAAGAPTGMVTLTNELSAVTGSAPIGTMTMLLTNVGTFHFAATYSGDTNFLPSSSSPPLSRTVLSMTNPVAWSAALVVFNGPRFLQTSLMQQWLTLSNITSQTLAAVRVTVHLSAADQAKHIIVYNASGTNAAGEPYLQHNYPVLPGDHVTFTAEFYSPDRVTVPTPTFTLELVTPEALVVPVSTPQAVRRPPVVLAPDNALLIDFLTVKGATYYILYKDDLSSTNWNVAQPPVTGTGYDMQWVDDGPPKTKSPPNSVPQRYYEVLKAN